MGREKKDGMGTRKTAIKNVWQLDGIAKVGPVRARRVAREKT